MGRINSLCLECGKNIIPKVYTSQQKYCSNYCYGKSKRKRLRSKLKEYEKKWLIENRSKRNAYLRRYHKENPEKRRENHRRWALRHQNYYKSYNHLSKRIKYNLEYNKRPEVKKMKLVYSKIWNEKYPDKRRSIILKYRLNNSKNIKRAQDKYYKSDKGKLNSILKLEKRRGKHKLLTGKNYDSVSENILNLIKERDKVCVYCKKKFDISGNPKTNLRYPHKDHLNANLPFSKNNLVLSCASCNTSKASLDKKIQLFSRLHSELETIEELERKILGWAKIRNIIPSKEVFNLLKMQKEQFLV